MVPAALSSFVTITRQSVWCSSCSGIPPPSGSARPFLISFYDDSGQVMVSPPPSVTVSPACLLPEGNAHTHRVGTVKVSRSDPLYVQLRLPECDHWFTVPPIVSATSRADSGMGQSHACAR